MPRNPDDKQEPGLERNEKNLITEGLMLIFSGLIECGYNYCETQLSHRYVNGVKVMQVLGRMRPG